MMSSWHDNASPISGHVWGESTGDWLLEDAVEEIVKIPLIWNAIRSYEIIICPNTRNGCCIYLCCGSYHNVFICSDSHLVESWIVHDQWNNGSSQWQGKFLSCVGSMQLCYLSKLFPDSKVHGANMGPTRVLPAPGGSHVGPMNLVIWVIGSKGVRKRGSGEVFYLGDLHEVKTETTAWHRQCGAII